MSETIKFDQPVVLVGGGEVDESLLRQFSHLPVIAADGGANFLRQISLLPAAVIGDLDSIEDKDYWHKNSRVIELAEQDTTDFEKCLYTTEAPAFIATGFTGSRFDHTLAALHVMQKYHQKKPVILVSGDDVLYVSSSSIDLRLPVGTRVSLYPLNRVSFKSSDGLHYPLDNLTMQTGEMIGTSNISDKSLINIVPEFGGGCFALILPLSQLSAMAQMHDGVDFVNSTG